MWNRVRVEIRKWREVSRPISAVLEPISTIFVTKHIEKCPKSMKNSIPGPVKQFQRRYQRILLRRAWMKNKYGIHALSWAGANEQVLKSIRRSEKGREERSIPSKADSTNSNN